jgi:hypothetical protein
MLPKHHQCACVPSLGRPLGLLSTCSQTADGIDDVWSTRPLPVLSQSTETKPPQPAKPRSTTCQRCCGCCQRAALNSGGNATAFVVQQPTGQSDRDSKTQLKDMVPLLQSLVWALLVGAIVIVLRSEIGGVLQGRHVKLSIAGGRN